MLFDLRSRRRRNVVRVVYILLAVLMIAGLVLVGVGTGNNNGGLLNAFTNNGSGGGGNPAADQALAAAIKAVKKHPNSAPDWAALVSARWSAASSGSNYNSTSQTFSAGGKAQLSDAAGAWQKYLTLSGGKPMLETSTLAAQVYQALKQWGNASAAWQYVIQSSPADGRLKGDLCTALTSYAAGFKSKGALAGRAALKAAPKADAATLKATLSAAKGSTSTAAQYASSEC